MATIVRKGELIDSAIRRFKKECDKAGIMNDFRNHEYFVSPSEKKREKRERNARMRARFAKKAAKEY